MLDAIEPVPTVSVHPADLEELGIEAGGAIGLKTRRGELVAIARRDSGMARGSIFMPFAYVEAAANLLTNPAIDPYGKIPEFKFCAVKVEGDLD